MRTIKFRVWNKKTNNWVEDCGPSDRNDCDGVNLFGETILFGHFMDGVSIEDFNECVALQYTGLDDKNGKGIFEGDIVRASGNNCEYEVDFGEHTLSDDYDGTEYCGFYLRAIDKSSWPVESIGVDSKSILTVIGNIYENPELLNGAS